MIWYRIKDFYWRYIRTIWVPQHSNIRKAVPRYWMDLDVIFENICFEIIKSFYEQEFKSSCIDWEGSGGRSVEFVEWLEGAYKHITHDKVALQQQIDEAYSSRDHKKIEKLEKKMTKKDTEVLIELVKWRGYMWT